MRRAGVIALTEAEIALPISGGAGHAAMQVTDRLNLGIVALEAKVGGDRVRSSGVVLDADQGLVLTSAHAVWGATSLKIATALGVLHGRIVARAPCDDIALVETQPRIPGLESLEAAQPGSEASGALLTAVGRRRIAAESGAGSLLTIPVQAVDSGRIRIDPKLRPLPEAIRLDGSLVTEATGGPIVDREGRLVAVAMVTGARHGGTGDAAILWPTILRRLDQLRVDSRRLYVGWHDQYRCVPALHAYARADHPGFRPIDARLNAPVPATRLPGTEGLDE